MDAATPYKICPRCREVTALSTVTCAKCGRRFRSTAPGANISSQLVSPTPTRSVRQPLSLPPQTVPPPDTSPHHTTIAISAQVLEEYTRQWVSLCWWGFWGVISAPTVVGLGLLIYSMIQRPELRRRVVEMGGDPEEFAREGNRRFYSGLTALLSWCSIAAVLVFVFIKVAEERQRPEQEHVSVAPVATSNYGKTVAEMEVRIRPGMTDREVEVVCGKPTSSQVFHDSATGLVSGMRRTYQGTDGELQVTYDSFQRVVGTSHP